MSNVAWWGIILEGWPVLSVLLVMSIVSFGVMYERWNVFSKIKTNTAAFIESIRKSASIQKVLEFCKSSDQPIAVITHAIFQSSSQRDDKDRVLSRSIQSLVQKLELNIPILGTIASVAPFVGLLGTVIGIIKSFRAVSMASSGGAGLVSLGIAEALVGTAGGLVVAIPALLGYNFFVNKLRRLTQDWELMGSEIIDMALEKGQK